MRSLSGLNANPVELAVKIAIRWTNYAWSYYATRKDGVWEPKIQSFGGLRSSVNSDGSANITDTTVTLFDTDSQLQAIATRGEAEGSLAIVYIDDQEIFRGQVRNAKWSDRDQTYGFDIVSFIESKEIGYVVEENIYTPNNEVVVGKPWPICFGKPQHVPAVFSQSTARGTISRPLNLGYNIFRDGWFEGGEYPLDEDIVEKTETELEAIIDAPIENGSTGVRPIRYILLEEQDYIKFPGTDDDPIEFKVVIEGVVFRVRRAGQDTRGNWGLQVLESNIAKYENLECGPRPNDDPDSENPKALWLDEQHTNVNMVGNIAYVEYTEVGYVYDEDARRERKVEYARLYENPCVRQEGLKCWFKYPFFHRKTPGSDSLDKGGEITDTTWGLCRPGVVIKEVKGVSTTGLIIDLSEFMVEMKEKLRAVSKPVIEGESRFTALADQLELVQYIKNAFWSAPEGTEIIEWEPEEGDIYIANYFTSSEVTGVYAYRKIKDKNQLVAVPSTYYEVDLSRTANLADGSTRQVTTIEFNRPLDTYEGQGWDASTIYVTLQSSVAGDGNPADIVEYILGNFTDYTLASFTGVANSLNNNPMHFAYSQVADAYELARQIAWQARSALVSDAGSIRMVNVSLDGSPYHVFTENNTYFQTLEVTQVNLDTLITKNIGKWKKHYGEDNRFTSWTVNQNKYGVLLKNHDMFAYNIESLANDALEFWTNRSGISWKIVEFEAAPAAMNLEIYDIVRLNFTSFPNLFFDKGVVIGYAYDFTNQTAKFTILTSVPAGETTNDPRFWFSPSGASVTNPANESEIKNYSLVDENFGKTLEEVVRELRKLEDTSTLFGKVAAINGTLITVDFYPFGPFNTSTKRGTAHDVNAHDEVKVGDWIEVKGGQDGVHYIRKAKLPKYFGLIDLVDGEPPTTNEYRVRIINFKQPYEVGITDEDTESNFENHYVGSTPPTEDDYFYVQARCFNEIAVGSAVGKVPNYSIVELHWATSTENEDGFWYFHADIDPKFRGQLGTAVVIGDNRWRYPFEQVKYTSGGRWTSVQGGLTGNCFNSIEANNTDTGVQGCGINVDNLPTGWAIQPLGAGAVVEITPVYSCETGEVEYVFEDTNNADGSCNV